jgi:hypothetical protein
MTRIKISDRLEAELLTADSNPIRAFTKYVKSPFIELIAVEELASSLNKPLVLAAPNPVAFGLTFKQRLELGTGETELNVGAGFRGTVGVHATSGDLLFSVDRLGEPIEVPPGKAYVSFAFVGSVRIGLNHEVGDLTFGFDASKSATIESFTLFPATVTTPTVGEALRNVLADFSIPGDVEDLRKMAVGQIAAVSGEGSFSLNSAINLATAVNPLASVNLPLNIGSLDVTAGGSVEVDAAFRVFGEYQIRAHKTREDKVRLGYYKKDGAEFRVGVSAATGVSATLRKRELTEKLIQAISSKPRADIAILLNGGLSDEAVENLQEAVAASVDRSLSASLELEFSALKSNEAAFLYEIDLNDLDETGEEAVHKALDGDLSRLAALDDSMPAHGITLVRSCLKSLKRRNRKLRINLFGIVNVLSLSELVRSGEVLWEPLTGELSITDRISAKRIRVVSTPSRNADLGSLSKALFEHMLITAAYRASRLLASLDLACRHSYFELHQKTNRQTLSDNLDAVMGLGLITLSEKEALLGADVSQFGVSTLFLDTEYDDASCQALFFDAQGKPFDQVHYERVGRAALLKLIQPGEETADRRIPLVDDQLWDRMKDQGFANFRFILPARLSRGPLLEDVIGDYSLIIWWAESMHKTAKKLREMKDFLGASDPATLKDNNTFKEKRKDLEKHLAGVVSKSKSRFGDPWGLLAMDGAAASHPPEATAVVMSPKLSLIRTRTPA